MPQPPTIVVIGGPNGAGKTTISREVVSKTLNIAEFVNADVIAQGLSGFDPERAAMSAGRIMLARLKDLAAARATFAFESTLSSRSFAPWLTDLTASGYEVHLVFVWLSSPTLAIKRVRDRIRKGGHSVPPDVIRRRYLRSVGNLVHLYIPIATEWRVYDNSVGIEPQLIASGERGTHATVENHKSWRKILKIAHGQATQDNP